MSNKKNCINTTNKIDLKKLSTINFFLIFLLVFVIFCFFIMNVGGSISPNYVTRDLELEECYIETKTVEIPFKPPKVDVVFAYDLTGSMGDIIDSAKTKTEEIIDQLINDGIDYNFGVISYKDYPDSYSSCGYTATYGTSTDYAYNLDQSLTSDSTAVITAINSLTLGSGGDYPEDYARIFYESYSDSSIGWRQGSKKLLVNFADNIPHDCNINEGVPGTTGILSTGKDPGRDEIIDTPDDLDLQNVLNFMELNGIILLECHKSESIYWDYWTSITGGSVIEISTTNFVDDVVDLINDGISATKIYDLHLEVITPGYSNWLSSVTPSSYSEVDTGTSVTFEETICVPFDASEGLHTFIVSAVDEDGVSYGDQINELSIINNPPVAVIDSISPSSVDEGESVSFSGTGSDSDGSVVAWEWSSSLDGVFGSSEDVSYSGLSVGTHTISFRVKDDDDAWSSMDTDSLSVNDPPVVVDDSDSCDEDGSCWTDVVANDNDVDGTLDLSTLQVTSGPGDGSTVVNTSTGEIEYTPDGDWNGVDSYVYSIADDDGATDTATVSISVGDVNDPPVVVDDSDSCDEDGSCWTDVVANDNDVDGTLDLSTLQVTSGPGDGSTVVNTSTGEIEYTPDGDWNGVDSYVYSIADDDGATDTATVSISVGDVNDPPKKPINIAPFDDETGVILNPILSVNVSDPEENLLNVSFYNGQTNDLIGFQNNVNSGNISSIIWSGLNYETKYTWYVIVNDLIDSTQSDLWNFTTKDNPPSGGGGGGGSNIPPEADASESQRTGFIDESIHFNGSKSTDFGLGYIVNYSWDFGDGKEGYGEITEHVYMSAGIYQVELTVMDNGGMIGTDEITVIITRPNIPPTIITTEGTTTGDTNIEYTYIINSTDPDSNDTVVYTFNWDDGTNTTSSVLSRNSFFNVIHHWSKYGVYIVVINATDSLNGQDSETITVLIDVIVISNDINGYLIDKNSDEIYDKFENTDTGEQTDLVNENDNYLIDSDGDGKWDHTFNSDMGLLTYEDYVYEKYYNLFKKELSTPGFELISLLVIIVLLAIIFKRRK